MEGAIHGGWVAAHCVNDALWVHERLIGGAGGQQDETGMAAVMRRRCPPADGYGIGVSASGTESSSCASSTVNR